MSSLLAWIGFFISLAVLLAVSRKSLMASMFLGALILGTFTLSPSELAWEFWSSFVDLSVVLLALAVGLIPLIGGGLSQSGQMNDLVKNLRIGKKAFLAFSPALVGMLPMPGGALLSAPLVEKAGEGMSQGKKAGLNVWFRHVLYLVYPLAPALIVSIKLANLDIYQILPYLASFLVFSLALGYFFFLRSVRGRIEYEEKFSMKKLLTPLTVILIAPLLDFSIKALFPRLVKEAATLIGVATSLIFVIAIGKIGLKGFCQIFRKSKPWDFALIIIGMIVFYNVFKASSIPELITEVQITPEILCVTIGFLLGFATGRIQLPAAIIIPIFATKFGTMSAPVFAIMFFSIFLGYVLTPVHPCVALSAKFFSVDLKDFFKEVVPPALIAFVVSFILFLILNV
jgi:integral membrane protein (TIGR00529 family)